ncbi:MAG: leucine-rich repeat domain-containing protein, partial [Bacteroidaceae bacterium]|nr:leucine-rich repeat domain-containing protein [Bacteroidaceae bacterium]
ALTSVTIGNSVTWIGSEAFHDCPELLDVYCYAEKVPSTESDAFNGSYPENATLHVPAASIDSYKATAPWSRFGKIVALTE